VKTSIFIAAAFMGLPLGQQAVAGYAFTTLNDPAGAFGTNPSGINDSGVVVGTYSDGSTLQHGFTESGGAFSNFDATAAQQTTGGGINNAGVVIGSYTDAGGQTHGYTRSGANYTPFDAPGVVGATTGTGINNAGNTTAYYFDGAGTHGLLNLTTVLDATGAVGLTLANAINNAGTVVGYYNDASGATHGFARSAGGVYSQIDDPLGALGTFAMGINDSGEIVGYFVDSLGVSHGFLDDGGAFSTLDVPGSPFTQINGINNQGVLIGVFADPTTRLTEGFVAAVPEPATMSLFGLGAFAMTIIRRRRR
jgi:probable HAF family extracellular repeat protein